MEQNVKCRQAEVTRNGYYNPFKFGWNRESFYSDRDWIL